MRKFSPLIFIIGLYSCQYSASPNATTAVSTPEAVAAPPAQSPAVTTAFLTGHFTPASDTNFVTVGKPYSSRTGMILQKQAFEAFKKMHEAALKEGITLNIISSTRTFEQQKNIWEGKWTRYADTKDPVQRAKRILEYSSMPGSSRHHWGTDIDLNDLNNPAFVGKGLHANAYQWLSEHAAEYGFGQPYTEIGPERPYGYNEEKWHWSYLPLAKMYRDSFVKNIKDHDISGFKGAETAVEIKVVERYVGGVSKACQ